MWRKKGAVADLRRAISALHEARQKLDAANVVLAKESHPEAMKVAAIVDDLEWITDDVKARAKARTYYCY